MRVSRKSSAAGADAVDPTHLYLRNVGHVSIFSPEEELQAATRIRELRVSRWGALLGHLPFVEPLANLIAHRLNEAPGGAGEQHPDEANQRESISSTMLDELRVLSRKVRDRPLKVHVEALAKVQAQFAPLVCDADVDDKLAIMVQADLTAMLAGEHREFHLQVRTPKHSASFIRYAEDVLSISAALNDAKRTFVSANLRLVISIARRFSTSQLPLQDLIQEGNIGLVKAVDRFDHRRGFRFSTYGSWWIRHAIGRAIADRGREIRIPVHMIERHNKIAKAKRAFEARHGVAPTEEQLLQAADMEQAKLETLLAAPTGPAIRLDQPVGDGETTVGDRFESHDPPATDTIYLAEMQEHLTELFSELQPIEADILRRRMGLDNEEELTLKEIGELYSLSRERIRQLQEQALRKLRVGLLRRGVSLKGEG